MNRSLSVVLTWGSLRPKAIFSVRFSAVELLVTPGYLRLGTFSTTVTMCVVHGLVKLSMKLYRFVGVKLLTNLPVSVMNSGESVVSSPGENVGPSSWCRWVRLRFLPPSS